MKYKLTEQLQMRAKYPGYAPHKAFHQNYKMKLREIASQIPDTPTVMDLSKLNSHIAVLVTHIRVEDKKLGQFLNQA